MTSQVVEGTWICTGSYRQFRGVLVNRVFVSSFSETEAVSEQTAEQTEIKETSPSPASEEEEPMDEN